MSKIDIKLPTIDKAKIFSTDNGGLALTTEMEQWFGDVVDILNFLIRHGITKEEATINELASLIIKINKGKQ